MRRVSRTNAAYIAGFFDGEGCISSTVAETKTYPTIRITLVQKNSSILDWIVKTLGFGHVYKSSNNRTHRITLGGKEKIERFIKIVLPYSKEKKPQLKLGLEFLTLVGKPSSNPLSKENLLKRTEIMKKLRELKHV